jgi:hypothetical protein
MQLKKLIAEKFYLGLCIFGVTWAHNIEAHNSHLNVTTAGEVIRSQLNKVRICYEHALKRQPNLQGRLVANFSIHPRGSIDQFSFTSNSEIQDREMRRCIANVFRHIKFPRSNTGKNLSISYPLVFTSPQADDLSQGGNTNDDTIAARTIHAQLYRRLSKSQKNVLATIASSQTPRICTPDVLQQCNINHDGCRSLVMASIANTSGVASSPLRDVYHMPADLSAAEHQAWVDFLNQRWIPNLASVSALVASGDCGDALTRVNQQSKRYDDSIFKGELTAACAALDSEVPTTENARRLSLDFLRRGYASSRGPVARTTLGEAIDTVKNKTNDPLFLAMVLSQVQDADDQYLIRSIPKNKELRNCHNLKRLIDINL